MTRLINVDPFAGVFSHALVLLAFVATMTYCARAQNIEGQPIAAQYGEFEVQNEGNGFSFDPANCNVSGGGANFPAFTTGTPVKVVDALPSQTEVSTTVTAFLSGSNCAVSLFGLAYQHASFYLTSGTGGLQEALNNEKINAGGNNTIILNARWYELIAPRTASTVISTVRGSYSFGLVDVTTNPYTSYNWNGSQYVQAVASGSSPSGAAGGVLSGNYPDPGIANPLNLSALNAISAGTFSNNSSSPSGTNTYLNALINGCSPATEVHSVQFNYAMTSGVVGCVTGPAAGSGVYQINGLAGLATSQDANVVGGYFQGRALANSMTAWGINPVVQDVAGLTSNVILFGQELDVQPYNAPSTYSGGYGLAINLINNTNNGGTYPFPALAFSARVNGGSTPAYWAQGLNVELGALPASPYNPVFYIQSQCASTGSVNCASPSIMEAFEEYGASQTREAWTLNTAIGTGTTPAADNFILGHNTFAGPAGQTHTFELANGIQLQLDGSTSGSAVLSASATGGTLNLGSTNANVTPAGALTVASCTGCTGASTNTVVQVDNFPSAGGTFAGTYSSGTTYTQYQTVTYSGADWICLSSCTGVTPAAAAAGSAQLWAPFDSSGAGLSATQADAAFFSAWGQVQAGASSFTAYSGVSLVFGNRLGGYNKNGDWVMPQNTYGFTISLYGQGRGPTWIHQTASTLNFMVNSPNVSSSLGQTIQGITLDANLLAGGCLSHHVRRSLVSDIACWNPQQQSSGTIGAPMWLGQGADSYETLYQHLLVRTPTYPGLVAAYGTATVTGGAVTGITFTGTGTNLNLPITAGPGLVTYFLGRGAGGTPCSTMPGQPTYTISSGSITGTTLGSGGSGCSGTVYVRVQEAGTMNDGYYLGGSDTTIDDIVTSGDFKVACEYVNGPFSLIHEHPYCAAPYQIQALGSGVQSHIAPEMDSPIEYGMYIDGSGATVTGGFAEFNAGNEFGAGDYLIDAGATNFSIASSGCYSGRPQNFGGYAKFTGTAAGPLVQGSSALPASGSITGTQENCDGSASLWGGHTALPTRFSVTNYGALCNGSTDDSTALQATITAAAVNGGNVVLPAATCNFATTLTRPRNVMIVGQGRNSSYLNYTGSTRAFVLGDTGANNPPSWKGGFQHLTLEGPSGTGSTVGLYMGADPAGIISPAGTLDDDEEWIDLAVLKFGIGATVNNNTYLLSAIDVLFANNGQHWKDISTNSNSGERMSFVSSIFGQSQSSTAPAIELDNNLADYYFTNGSMDYNNTSQPDIACLAGDMHVTLTNMHMEKLHGEKIHVNNTVCNAEIHIFGGTWDTTGTGTTDPDMIGLSGIYTSQNVVSVVGAAVEANEPLTQFIDANNPSRQITVDSLAWENFGNLGACVNNEGNAAGITVRNTVGCASVEVINGATSGQATLSASATGGTLNLGSTNATVSAAGAITGQGFFPQSVTAGPYASYFDDFLTTNGLTSQSIGSPTGSSCSTSTTYLDNTSPGNISAISGTGGSGTGIDCVGAGGALWLYDAATSPNWTWETRVLVPVLPGTTAGSYQAGMAHTWAASPWASSNIGFYLSSANGTANNWYCEYYAGSTSTVTNSTVAAVASTWTRLSLVNDGTYVHWYINGTEATACKTVVGSMPTTAISSAWTSVAGSSTSVTMAVDYVAFHEAVSR